MALARSIAKPLLWLGGVFTEEAMLRNRWISPAGNRWMAGLLAGLAEQPLTLHALGHQYERVFPFGKLRPGDEGELRREGYHNRLVRYWNCPKLRDISLASAYTHACEQIISQHGRPGALLTYNPYAYNAMVGRALTRKHDVPWIPIILDFHDPGPDWSLYKRDTAGAAGHVFLSWWAYEQCPVGPKLYLDGGVSVIRAQSGSLLHWRGPEGRPVILYTGAVGTYKGVDQMLEAFLQLEEGEAELWICGKPMLREGFEKIQEIAHKHPFITYYGAVSEQKLEELSRQTSAFVNPRPPGIVDHQMNFPSKLLEYLSYGKPVISTMTPGVGSEYRDLLIVPEEESVSGLAGAMREVLALDAASRLALNDHIVTFLESTRTWPCQAQRLVDWIASEVGPST